MDAGHPLAVVTPTLDGEVLAYLARAEAAFTPGQLARLLPKASVEGVRKVLKRLVAQGVVTSVRVGNAAVTYQLNRQHLAAEPIMALANPVAALRSRLDVLMETWQEPPVYAALFGSWARGNASVDSDVDLFLVRPAGVDEEVWATQVDALQHSVSLWTGNDARPYVVDASDLQRLSTDPVL